MKQAAWLLTCLQLWKVVARKPYYWDGNVNGCDKNIFKVLQSPIIYLMGQKPSINTQHHSPKSVLKYALATWFIVSTWPYIIIYLYDAREEAIAQRPSRKISVTAVIFLSIDVKGATILASVFESAIPT